MSLATLAQNQAANAIRRYGMPGTLTRTTLGTFDPATGTSASSSVSVPIKATQGATNIKSLGFKFGEGLVQTGDFALDIPAKGLPFVPKAGDAVAITSGDLAGAYKVVDNKPTVVGRLAAIHSLLVRA